MEAPKAAMLQAIAYCESSGIHPMHPEYAEVLTAYVNGFLNGVNSK